MSSQSLNQKPVHLTEGAFDRVIARPGRVALVDFYSDSCGPCRRIAPVIDDLAEDLHGSVLVGKVDVGAEPGLAGRFGIQAVPTLIIFRDGQPADTIRGAVPRAEIERRIEAVVTKGATA